MFFFLSKLTWALIQPSFWLLVALIIGLIAIWRGRLKSARRWVGGVVLTLITLNFVPVGDFLFAPLENEYPANPDLTHVDGILVLGGPTSLTLSSHWDQLNTHSSAERLIQAAVLAHRFPGAKLIYSGGSGSILRPELSGASFTRRFLGEIGLDPDRVFFEDKARNTPENLALSKAMMNPQPDEVWVLVTSAFHMPRSMALAERADWNMIAYPVDHRHGAMLQRPKWALTRNLEDLNTAAREWVGITVYWWTDRIDWPFGLGE